MGSTERNLRPALTRRRFINLVGKAGGVAAAYNTMAAMGLLAVPPAHARPPSLPGGSGRGTRVIILGAGIAGMTAAYELAKAGYECVILEARRAQRGAQLDDPRRRAGRRDRYRPDRGLGTRR